MNKEWNGEGLPPVGCECKYAADGNYYYTCKIMYISETGILLLSSHVLGGEMYFNFYDCSSLKFRPIKSKQEIEREEVTEEILDLFDALDCPSVRHVEAICTAGYRNNGEEVSECALAFDYLAKINTGLNIMSRASAEVIGKHLIKHFKIYPRNP